MSCAKKELSNDDKVAVTYLLINVENKHEKIFVTKGLGEKNQKEDGDILEAIKEYYCLIAALVDCSIKTKISEIEWDNSDDLPSGEIKVEAILSFVNEGQKIEEGTIYKTFTILKM